MDLFAKISIIFLQKLFFLRDHILKKLYRLSMPLLPPDKNIFIYSLISRRSSIEEFF
jgi:hypothetical protein